MSTALKRLISASVAPIVVAIKNAQKQLSADYKSVIVALSQKAPTIHTHTATQVLDLRQLRQAEQTWDASENTPALPVPSDSNKNMYYVVSVGGAPTIGGVTMEVNPDDWVISDGTKWMVLRNTIPPYYVKTKDTAVMTKGVAFKPPPNSLNMGTVYTPDMRECNVQEKTLSLSTEVTFPSLPLGATAGRLDVFLVISSNMTLSFGENVTLVDDSGATSLVLQNGKTYLMTMIVQNATSAVVFVKKGKG